MMTIIGDFYGPEIARKYPASVLREDGTEEPHPWWDPGWALDDLVSGKWKPQGASETKNGGK
jgi:hypothetical protein